MDYGHSLEFGYFLIPDAGDPRGVLETARLADRLGTPTMFIDGVVHRGSYDAATLLQEVTVS
jgi:hypothetical protein